MSINSDRELLNSASMYFENNKDLMAANDFETAMKLGCFDKEFTYYGVGYLEVSGKVAYRISSQRGRLYQFIRESAGHNIYPTPVVRYMKRCPAPSGHEEQIKVEAKRETAGKIRSLYNRTFFEALKPLSDISPSNRAYNLLKEQQDMLEGEYDESKLRLFENLVHVAVESKQLTIMAELEFDEWLKDIRKQMEDDIVAKGPYKKILTGFAYRGSTDSVKYYYDAKPEVTFEAEAEYQKRRIFHTPVFQKEYWLKDTSAFFKVKKKFEQEMQAYLSEEYWNLLREIKAMPSVIDLSLFEEKAEQVKLECSEEAYNTLLSYGYRWNLNM